MTQNSHVIIYDMVKAHMKAHVEHLLNSVFDHYNCAYTCIHIPRWIYILDMLTSNHWLYLLLIT